MIQPRLGATWAYNGRDTIYASYARYNPAASSLPRAASWDRNLATTINAHFDANGVLVRLDQRRVLVRQAVRRRHDAADDRRSDDRHGAAVQQPLVDARSTGAIARRALLGGHEQQRARSASTRRPSVPARALHPGSHAASRRDRQRLELRHRRARRRLHEVLRSDGRIRVAQRQGVRARLVHLEPLLRQLRSGQLDDGQRRQHLHRLVVHRRRRRPSAVGLPRRRPARRPAHTWSSSTATTR